MRGDSYRYDLDLLKGLAIIAVVLYHVGWCKSGYLGVDLFLVLNGYLVVPQVIRQIDEGRFRYWTFIEKKIFRLLPLVLIVSILSLAIGYWGMLPNDLRFLSEEAVAASTFMNNVLQAITTQNYWAAIYQKVLMHTWFLGVLFQFYVVFPLLMLLMRRRMMMTLIVLTFLSILLYQLPVDSIGNKYYLLPYRFFEIAIGGLVAIRAPRVSTSMKYFSVVGLFLMIFFALQSCVFPFIPFLSAAPNLVLILTFSYGFIYGSRAGLIYGFMAGLLLDLFYSGAFGFFSLFFMWIGFMNGRLSRYYRNYSRRKTDLLFYLGDIVVPEIIITLLFTLLIYRFFLWYNRKLEILDEKHAVN